VDSY